jgi:hypothetical protein
LKQSIIQDEADLWEASPIRVDWTPDQDALYFLPFMFKPDDLIFIGDHHEPGVKNQNIKNVSAWISYFKNGGKTAPHIIINPLSGLPAEKKTGAGETFRGDGNVKEFRYCIAEFDLLSREDQFRFWTAVKLPVACLIDSGGKSIHAWIKLSEITKADQWEKEIKGQLYEQGLIPLGVDRACSNPARLSRLPGHFRADKGKYQRLLWLAEPENGKGNK